MQGAALLGDDCAAANGVIYPRRLMRKCRGTRHEHGGDRQKQEPFGRLHSWRVFPSLRFDWLIILSGLSLMTVLCLAQPLAALRSTPVNTGPTF